MAGVVGGTEVLGADCVVEFEESLRDHQSLVIIVILVIVVVCIVDYKG